jgi:hypothetical protein
MDNHGLACVSVWHKSATMGEIWPFMQDEAGNAPPQQAELMLALRLGIAGMLGLWHLTLAIVLKLRRITSQTLH